MEQSSGPERIEALLNEAMIESQSDFYKETLKAEGLSSDRLANIINASSETKEFANEALGILKNALYNGGFRYCTVDETDRAQVIKLTQALEPTGIEVQAAETFMNDQGIASFDYRIDLRPLAKEYLKTKLSEFKFMTRNDISYVLDNGFEMTTNDGYEYMGSFILSDLVPGQCVEVKECFKAAGFEVELEFTDHGTRANFWLNSDPTLQFSK